LEDGVLYVLHLGEIFEEVFGVLGKEEDKVC
jgi:hypothetical protein